MKSLSVKNISQPTRVFTGFILLLIAIIGILSISRNVETPESTPTKPKEISIVTNHTVVVTSIAEVEDSSVVTLISQAGGVVSSVFKDNGDSVRKGDTIIALGSNYAGGNAASVQSQIAARQLVNYQETYDSQIESIDLQKDLARAQDEVGDRTREIGRESLERTQSIVDTNETSISSIEKTISSLEGIPGSEDQITTLTATLNQLIAANSQLISANSVSDYQASDSEAPAHISDVSEELALKQLDIQRESFELQGEILSLQKRAAEIQASAFYPSSPFDGTVIETFVHPLEVISPGTKIATIKAPKGTIRLTTYVPFEVAQILSLDTVARATLTNSTHDVQITYIGTYPAKGDLYPVTLILENSTRPIADKSYLDIEFSIDAPCETFSDVCYLPLESLTITQDASYISVVDPSNTVHSEEVTIDALLGNSAKVRGENLSQKDILTRTNVTDGESVVRK